MLKLNCTTLQKTGYGLPEESVEMLAIDLDENIDWKCQIKKLSQLITYYGDIVNVYLMPRRKLYMNHLYVVKKDE